jgi:hypothetical protein
LHHSFIILTRAETLPRRESIHGLSSSQASALICPLADCLRACSPGVGVVSIDVIVPGGVVMAVVVVIAVVSTVTATGCARGDAGLPVPVVHGGGKADEWQAIAKTKTASRTRACLRTTRVRTCTDKRERRIGKSCKIHVAR